jgi:hypothetical protein
MYRLGAPFGEPPLRNPTCENPLLGTPWGKPLKGSPSCQPTWVTALGGSPIADLTGGTHLGRSALGAALGPPLQDPSCGNPLGGLPSRDPLGRPSGTPLGRPTLVDPPCGGAGCGSDGCGVVAATLSVSKKFCESHLTAPR